MRPRSTTKLALTLAMLLTLSRPAASTTFDFPGSNGTPTDLNGWVGAVDNFLLGSNLQSALPVLQNPVNVLTGTYTGCTAGSGSGCVKGTGRTGTDGTWSSGTTFTSATGNFTSNDSGKSIWITERNLDALGTQFVGTVTFVNSTTLTLSSTPSFSGSMTNAHWVLGVDDGANILNATNAGDILIPAGVYITGTSITLTTNYHNIQCEDGAIIVNPWHANSPHDVNAIAFKADHNSLIGCTLQGTNVPVNSSTKPGYDANTEFNRLLFIGFSHNGNFVAGNHFSYGWANDEMSLEGSTTLGSSQNTIVDNTFDNAGLYGLVITEGDHNIVMYNKFQDANCCVEGNSGDTTATENANVVAFNKAVCVNGAGNSAGAGSMYFTGGNAANVNYTGNQVFSNVISGCASGSGVWLWETNSAGTAVYTNNQCGSGCTVHP